MASNEEQTLQKLKERSTLTFAVVFPARNEEKTIGNICSTILKHVSVMNLIDELIVMNDRSTDDTFEATTAAFDNCNDKLHKSKCRIFNTKDLLSYNDKSIPSFTGKGAVLWKSLLVTTSSVIVFIDADHREYDLLPIWIIKFIKCYLYDNNVQFVKGYFSESIKSRNGVTGRVSELVMIPLQSILFPNIPACIHPGCGEQSAKREFLINITNFPAHYAVECCLWIEANLQMNKSQIKQIDLVKKDAKKQSTISLRLMSATISSYLIKRKFNLFDHNNNTTTLLGEKLKSQDLNMNDIIYSINIDVFPSVNSYLKSKQNFCNTKADWTQLFIVTCLIFMISVFFV